MKRTSRVFTLDKVLIESYFEKTRIYGSAGKLSRDLKKNGRMSKLDQIKSLMLIEHIPLNGCMPNMRVCT